MLSETISSFLARLHPSWHSDALCREYPDLSWFPERGASTLEQRAICARCIVGQECAEAAMATPASEDHGICAGMSPGLRKRLHAEGKTPDLEFIAAAVAIEVAQHARRNALRAA
jgi:WhiB family redox-sensing transcriptional regulator